LSNKTRTHDVKYVGISRSFDEVALRSRMR
jgi:hypothetical protein